MVEEPVSISTRFGPHSCPPFSRDAWSFNEGLSALPEPPAAPHHEDMSHYTSERTLFRAPGGEQLTDQARDQAEASGWISEENLTWPSVETRDGVIDRRQKLYEAMRGLEAAVARPSGLADWRIEIEAALTELEAALRSHVRQVEADDGLFAQVMEESPHLAPGIDSLRREHNELVLAAHTALRMSADWEASSLRRRVNTLLGRLAIHRQTGAELLFRAYNVEIGGSG